MRGGRKNSKMGKRALQPGVQRNRKGEAKRLRDGRGDWEQRRWRGEGRQTGRETCMASLMSHSVSHSPGEGAANYASSLPGGRRLGGLKEHPGQAEGQRAVGWEQVGVLSWQDGRWDSQAALRLQAAQWWEGHTFFYLML